MVTQSANALFAKKPNSKGLFTKKPQPDHKEEIHNMNGLVNNAVMRLRILEERNQRLNERLQLTDQSVLRINKRLSQEVKVMNEDIADLKLGINEIKEKIMLMIKELRTAPKKEEFEILRKYIEMWEPLNFVTHKEVEKIVREQLAKTENI